MKAIVIGAGIGGLSAAIALRKAGIEAMIFERAWELREIGAGLSLTANATKALNGLGLAGALQGIGVPIEVAYIRTWRGQVLSRIPVWQLDEKVGARSAAVHRADLQGELLHELGEGVVRLGAAFTGFAQEDGSVRAFFADGTEERGDLLVGADGLRSTVREELLDDGAPRYAGYTTWRTVVAPQSELVPSGEAVEVWGRGVRFICAPVGRGRVYWAVSKNAPEGEHDVPGVKNALLELCAGWFDPIEELISTTEESAILRTDVFDRDPLRKRWGEGRVTLLGDAAHPMTPDLGQGACQAIEDAVVLASCLNQHRTEDLATALELYEARRAKRTAALVRGSRRTGRIAQLQNPLLCRLRDAALKALPTRLQLKQLEAVMGYEEQK